MSSKPKSSLTDKLLYTTTTEQITSLVEALTESSLMMGGEWKIARQKSCTAQKNSLRNTESIAQLLMEARMRHRTRPVHRLTLDHCFKPVLTSGTFHHLHTFKVPPSSTCAQSSSCLVTVSEQIVEKHSCGEDVFLSTGSPANSRCLDKFLTLKPSTPSTWKRRLCGEL